MRFFDSFWSAFFRIFSKVLSILLESILTSIFRMFILLIFFYVLLFISFCVSNIYSNFLHAFILKKSIFDWRICCTTKSSFSRDKKKKREPNMSTLSLLFRLAAVAQHICLSSIHCCYCCCWCSTFLFHLAFFLSLSLLNLHTYLFTLLQKFTIADFDLVEEAAKKHTFQP